MTRKYVFLAFTEPVAGEEDAYNAWYDGQHLVDVLAIPGFLAAQRFAVRRPAPVSGAQQRYLTVYEIESDDIDSTMAELLGRKGGAAMPLSPALNLDAIETVLVEQVGPRAVAE